MTEICSNITELATVLIEAAASAGVTISTAESCTGGWIGKALTEISGSSAAFMGGVIAYDNAVKISLLDVPADTLNTVGAVSPETAEFMAQNIRRKLETDYGVSVTGIAGPGGGTPDKPVGLVYVGLARPGGDVEVTKCEFGNIGRNEVRVETVKTALGLLIDAVG